jgi:hypothetical protein
MSPSMRSAVGLCALLACGGSSAEPETPDEAAPEPTEVTAQRVEATPEASGLPVSGAAPEPGAAQGKRAPCTTDQSCNENPSVSSLWGRCTPLGVCECKDGFERSPTSDLCRPED